MIGDFFTVIYLRGSNCKHYISVLILCIYFKIAKISPDRHLVLKGRKSLRTLFPIPTLQIHVCAPITMPHTLYQRRWDQDNKRGGG